jgi:hypothetical protein
MSPDDKRWPLLVYATVLVPLIGQPPGGRRLDPLLPLAQARESGVGQPLVVFASSILYYRWRKRWPRAASRLNVHAWVAVALNIGLTLAVLRIVRVRPVLLAGARRNGSSLCGLLCRMCGSAGRCAGAIVAYAGRGRSLSLREAGKMRR